MQTNFLIIGSGAAGLNLAIKLAPKGDVLLVTKNKLQESNSSYAQGGIAAVNTTKNPNDSFEKHVEDTMIAGHNHNNLEAVKILVENGPKIIKELQEIGVNFANKLGREGGHSENRIHHVGDYTGQAITEALIKKVKKTPNIKVLENCFATDLTIENGKCYGAKFLFKEKDLTVFAGQTILATGGLGQVFEKTTNPKIATGDGIAMAIRSHVEIEDLEYIQFHPTALDIGETPLFLISEAVRGEGAKIINSNGEYFMKQEHKMADLAPRDIVSNAIYKEQKLGKKVYLDCREFKRDFLEKRFPKIYKNLTARGLQMEKDLLPITPAAHYSCGGIKVNFKGETNIKNLYACGEVACTKVHGKNRLASNSLLEALVFGNIIAENIKSVDPKKIETRAAEISTQEIYEEKNKNILKTALDKK
jgi:L-aspartate oxidase